MHQSEPIFSSVLCVRALLEGSICPRTGACFPAQTAPLWWLLESCTHPARGSGSHLSDITVSRSIACPYETGHRALSVAFLPVAEYPANSPFPIDRQREVLNTKPF